MTFPKLLIATSAIPAQSTGGCMLDLAYIQFLSQHYTLFLVHFRDENQAELTTEHLTPYCHKIIEIPRRAHSNTFANKTARLLNILPRYVSLIDQGFVEKTVTAVIQDESISRFFCTSMWANCLIPAACRNTPHNHTLSVNVEYRLLASGKGLKAQWDAFRTRLFEKKLLSGQSHLAALTSNDSQLLETLTGNSFTICPPFLAPHPLKTKPDATGALLTTNMTFEPNRISFDWLVHSVLPHLPDKTVIKVAGKDYNNILSDAEKMHPQIQYVGFQTAAQFEELFENTAIVINPTITGSGFQIKTLDALSRSKILISTSFSNHLGPIIQSSDDAAEFARLMLQNMQVDTAERFDYQTFYTDATKKLLSFLDC